MASTKTDEGVPETKAEQEARVAKKTEDNEVYHQTRHEIKPDRRWSAEDEWGSGARCIRLNKGYHFSEFSKILVKFSKFVVPDFLWGILKYQIMKRCDTFLLTVQLT